MRNEIFSKFRSSLRIAAMASILMVLTACTGQKFQEHSQRHPNGKLWETWQEDSTGMKQGKGVTYYPDGNVQTEVHYKNDYLHGQFKMWDQKGNLIADGIYEDGKEWSGRFVFVDEQNQRVVFKEYEKGKLIK